MPILLVGIDFSTRSDRALRRAVLLARKARYELLLVAVLESETPDASREDEASAILLRIQRTIEDEDGVPCRMEVRTGSPSEQLAKAARAAGVHAMVIGPHRKRLIRAPFGAVTAERIVQQSQIPVIAANTLASGPYRRLLLPVDLEDASHRATEALRGLALAEVAEIVLLHTYDPEAREMLGRAMVSQESKRDYLSERADMASKELEDFAVTSGLDGAAQFVREAQGPLAAGIERFALEDGTNLIIVSRSQKGPIARCVLGSVTEDLLRAGKFDVLVAPSAPID